MPKKIDVRQIVLVSVWCLLFCLQSAAVKSQDDQWTPLFNGKDLTGWKQVGKGTNTVENGLIRSSGGMGLLYSTKGKFENCTIQVVFKMQKFNSNSGVFVRIPIQPFEEWMPVYYSRGRGNGWPLVAMGK